MGLLGALFALAFALHCERNRSKSLAVGLEEERRRFLDIAAVSSDWIWETDAEGRFRYVSAKVTRFLGYTPEELIGRSACDLIQIGRAHV